MMEAHHDGYRFSDRVEERVFCPGMMLLAELARRRMSPSEMLDPDLRDEYERLLRFGAMSAITTAERRAFVADIQRQGHTESRSINDFGDEGLFPERQVLSSFDHCGLLTLGRWSPDRATQRLEIPPNRVIRDLRWE